MITDYANPSEEGTRRDDALALLTANRAHWIRFAQREFLACLLGEPAGATADRVSHELPLAIRKSCTGAAVCALATAGLIVPTGCAGRARIWRIADPAAARRWAADHPPLPDPDDTPAAQGVLFSVHDYAY